MRKLQIYISVLFIFTSFLGFIITLKNIGMSDRQYYGINNKQDITTLGEYITGIFILGLIIQFIASFFLILFHFYNLFKHKSDLSEKILRVYGSTILLIIIWGLITSLIQKNGQNDLLWGPGDTGLFFVSVVSLLINYLILCFMKFDKLVSPLKLFKNWL